MKNKNNDILKKKIQEEKSIKKINNFTGKNVNWDGLFGRENTEKTGKKWREILEAQGRNRANRDGNHIEINRRRWREFEFFEGKFENFTSRPGKSIFLM